jgi:hypothetical protein
MLTLLKTSIGVDEILFGRGGKVKVIPTGVSAITRRDTWRNLAAWRTPRFFGVISSVRWYILFHFRGRLKVVLRLIGSASNELGSDQCDGATD